jgi:(2Fe-2S) ferredoxin
MGRYERHVFVCVNERPPGDPKGCCLEKGSAEVRDALKAELRRRGLSGVVRANNAGCLDACAHGVSMVIYPEGIWYGRVQLGDVGEIIERTIIGGEVIPRLLIDDHRYAPPSTRVRPLTLPAKGVERA